MSGPVVSRPRGAWWRAAVVTLAIASAVVLAASAQTPAALKTKHLRLVSTVWTPFTNPSGQPRFALDLVEAALGRLGVTSNTAMVDAPQFTSSLLGGTFDGTGAAWKDAEREKASGACRRPRCSARSGRRSSAHRSPRARPLQR